MHSLPLWAIGFDNRRRACDIRRDPQLRYTEERYQKRPFILTSTTKHIVNLRVVPDDMWPSLPQLFARPLLSAVDGARSKIGSLTWVPALSTAKPAVLSVLSQVEKGTLVLVDEPGETKHIFGQEIASKPGKAARGTGPSRQLGVGPWVTLIVKQDEFWMRTLLFGDMGFAESYMLGEIECEDLTSFFELFILNRDQLSNGTTWISAFSSAISVIARSTNTLSNALLNISAHYDISNEMFAAFLSPDMTYSCPVWDVQPSKRGTPETLEEAQMRKLRRFIDGAKLRSSDHVLEIGTGWGSFAIEAVKRTGCRVTSLTLSKEQLVLAEERIRQANVEDRVDIKLMDYRALPTPEVPFDKIVSIEMLEAVGQEYLGTYFSCIDRLLKRDGGIAMFQCITMPENRHDAAAKSDDFIKHYIFPGGFLPSITELLNHISSASQGTLIVEKVENIGGHYTRALRLWREAFLTNFETRIRPALQRQHPSMSEAEFSVFQRKWEYYFTYCEAGFVTKTLGDVIITVGRERAQELMEGIPL